METKQVFTTGEVANLLHVHQTTIIDWIQKGMLKAYHTPGGHRRVEKNNLIGFLESHKMPIPHDLVPALKPSEQPQLGEKLRHLHEGYQENPYSTPTTSPAKSVKR